MPILLNLLALTYADRGILKLDNTTFDRIVDGHRNVFVRFDKEYAYGDENDAWKEFAKTVAESAADMLIADVGVSEYGDKDNADLADRYSIALDDFPQYRLFKRSKDPLKYAGEKTKDALLRYVQSQAGVWIGLPGQIESLDAIAKKLASGGADKQALLDEAAMAASASTDDMAKYYVKVMTKAGGDADFITKESTRLTKMMGDASVKPSKKEQFSRRLNVLSSFS